MTLAEAEENLRPITGVHGQIHTEFSATSTPGCSELVSSGIQSISVGRTLLRPSKRGVKFEFEEHCSYKISTDITIK